MVQNVSHLQHVRVLQLEQLRGAHQRRGIGAFHVLDDLFDDGHVRPRSADHDGVHAGIRDDRDLLFSLGACPFAAGARLVNALIKQVLDLLRDVGGVGVLQNERPHHAFQLRNDVELCDDAQNLLIVLR